MVKKVLLSTLAFLVLLFIIYWDLVSYGLQQAKGQLTIISNTQDVSDVLASDNVPDSIKHQIRNIEEARLFAFDSLGLKQSDNYTTFYAQKGQVSLWNLSASEPFALEPKLWSFPILGSFPYKGFFDLEKAKTEAKELKDEGYDVRIRPVGGWSTLGWTKDPILSNMLRRTEGSLVELIIHELTHSTLFVKDDIEFNENLASFIGEKGAVAFLNNKYGKGSSAYYDYIISEEDSETFRDHMLLAAGKLDSLYQSMIEISSDSIKSKKKEQMINEIIISIDTLHFHNERYYQIFQNTLPNNAYFMSYLRYYSSNDSLESLLSNSYDNDLRSFIEGMVEYHK